MIVVELEPVAERTGHAVRDRQPADLRHSAATAMLNAGVPLHVVSRVLGHSSVSITGDIYGHADDRTRRGAIDALGNAIGL